MPERFRKAVHWLYYVVVTFKSIDALIETVLGILFFTRSLTALRRTVAHLTAPILGAEPDNQIAHALRHAFATMHPAQKIGAAAFLLGHGLIKSAIVIGLWLRWRWAFWIAVIALVGFTVWEAWHCLHAHSAVTGIAAAVDLAAAVLIWTEGRSRGMAWRPKRTRLGARVARAK